MHPSITGVHTPAALQRGVELALLAPSVHDTQPWLFEPRDDRLVVRADRSRQLAATDPTDRELVGSVGAALFNVRVGCAASGRAAEVTRLPDPDDADLLAVVRPGAPAPDPALARLEDAVRVLRTARPASTAEQVPDDVLRGLAAGAATEGALLVPVLEETHRRLLARLAQQADRIQNADPAQRAELRRWTNRRSEDRAGVPVAAGPRVDGGRGDEVLPREYDTVGTGSLLVLATRTDDPLAWLRCGEAMQRVLLELVALGWAASPSTQLVQVPLTRTQLRSALTWDAHPQLLLRVGRAGSVPATSCRAVHDTFRTV